MKSCSPDFPSYSKILKKKSSDIKHTFLDQAVSFKDPPPKRGGRIGKRAKDRNGEGGQKNKRELVFLSVLSSAYFNITH